MKNDVNYKKNLTNTKVHLEQELESLIGRSLNQSNSIVRQQYEKLIEKKAKELEDVEGKLAVKPSYDIPCRTS
jgi:hypothetical protein